VRVTATWHKATLLVAPQVGDAGAEGGDGGGGVGGVEAEDAGTGLLASGRVNVTGRASSTVTVVWPPWERPR
jgi:hypothetical protein